jgi:FtsP/CotA-like multicopper oxidase with cupredoxin domain
MLTRRHLLTAAATAGFAVALPRPLERYDYRRALGSPSSMRGGKTVEVALVSQERQVALPCFNGKTLPMWTFTDGAWPPVIRLNHGDRLHATLENKLPRADQLNSIHWHGIRLPNSQDGVPYLVQQPIEPGQRCEYSFVPPDTGTFFFHTHCNTVEQLGRGLMGVLIIDGDTTEPYDADQLLLLRDWRIDADAGEFNSFYTLRGAARAGSCGAVRSVNGQINPEIRLPAGGDCRLRLVNTDPTRILRIGIEDAEAAIVAIDGVAARPFTLSTWMMAPGTRIDLVIRAPQDGEAARLVDSANEEQPVTMARLVGQGAPRRLSNFDPAPLRRSRVPEPTVAGAPVLDFVFETSDAGRSFAALADLPGAEMAPLCMSEKYFWTINGNPWPDHGNARLPPPLAVLARNRSYVFRMRNNTPFTHPIHIHGHSFTRYASTRQKWTPHNVDTFLLLPGEEAHSAIVADNPGDWMIHCHILEHQESGMMGYFRVT